MHDFEYIISLEGNDFIKAMAEIDSSELITYLMSCTDLEIKEKYYKKTKDILGIGYLNLLKMAVDGKDTFTDIVQLIKNKIKNDILKFDDFGINNNWTINKNNIHNYLVEPRLDEYYDVSNNEKKLLWTVFEDENCNYSIVYSEENNVFGLTMIDDENKRLFLGFHGGFAETFSSM